MQSHGKNDTQLFIITSQGAVAGFVHQRPCKNCKVSEEQASPGLWGSAGLEMSIHAYFVSVGDFDM